MSDIVERLGAFYASMNSPPSPGLPDGAGVVLEAKAEIERLKGAYESVAIERRELETDLLKLRAALRAG